MKVAQVFRDTSGYRPPLIIHKRTYDFLCESCGLPGESESPNCKVHQTRACKEKKAKLILARSLKRQREKKARLRQQRDGALVAQC